ncbi:MAG: hypothetical protein ACTSU3_02245 [Candidatus Thorarchaeota archaeon]
MPVTDFPSVLEIKDPLHGYIKLNELELKLLDLRMSQRLRYIRAPAGIHLVYPGADSSQMGRMLGVMHVTGIFSEYLGGGEIEDVNKARLTAMLIYLTTGPWSNVMKEYLTVRGYDRTKMTHLIIEKSPVTDILKESSYSLNEIKDLVEKGVPLKGLRVNLITTPINPELVDNLERDSYFAGVEYAQLEIRRLFESTRITKNKIAFDRNSLFTLDSYLTAEANMFEAVYYHKTVRAAELMLLRILDESGSTLFPFPGDDIDGFVLCDDLTFDDILKSVTAEDSEGLRTAQRIFLDFKKRNLIKLASSRAIADIAFHDTLKTPGGLLKVEAEIAEDAGIDSKNIYVDYPDRPSVPHYPGQQSMDDLVVFERGSRGYEFWPVEDVSGIAKSFQRKLKTIRIYTTRGYRAKVKKSGDSMLESFDGSGSF